MAEPDDLSREVDQFLVDRIDTVPHLEALLLVWKSRPKVWSADDMAKELFVPLETAKKILDDLLRQNLINLASGVVGGYVYESQADRDRLLGSVNATYRRELIRLSGLIHSKPPAAIREFARAFRLKKEHD